MPHAEVEEEEARDSVAAELPPTPPPLRMVFSELREKSEEKKVMRRSIIMLSSSLTSAAMKKGLWEAKATEARDRQAVNVFSGSYDKSAAALAFTNRPHEGSPRTTEGRALEASQWIESEIDKLLGVIASIGDKNNGDSEVSVTFGELFDAYTDISDTLVGILMRAKKRNLVQYPGQMLYQGASGKVKIVLVRQQLQPL